MDLRKDGRPYASERMCRGGFGASVSSIKPSIPRGQEERTGYEQITGKTPDISECCDFEFYDRAWYWPNTHPPLTTKNRQLTRWVGVAHRIGSDMCYWLIPQSGIPISDTTVQHVTLEDIRNPAIKKQIDEFDEELTKRLDDSNFVIQGSDDFYLDDMYDEVDEQTYGDGSRTSTDQEYQLPEERSEEDSVEQYDNLIGATFLLDPKNGDNKNLATKATVKSRVVDHF